MFAIKHLSPINSKTSAHEPETLPCSLACLRKSASAWINDENKAFFVLRGKSGDERMRADKEDFR